MWRAHYFPEMGFCENRPLLGVKQGRKPGAALERREGREGDAETGRGVLECAGRTACLFLVRAQDAVSPRGTVASGKALKYVPVNTAEMMPVGVKAELRESA